MALPNAFGQYNNSKILTASPAELTLMLYEGAIKFCNIAITAVESNDVEKSHIYIRKVERIIDYLRQILEEVNEHLRTTRDTWKEVMKKGRE